jgi:hypothetical protein
MPTNVFFERGGTTSEKRLLEDLISENIQIHGHDCYYLPRKLINRDLILNEDTLSKFNTAYLIEMYFEGDSFQGEVGSGSLQMESEYGTHYFIGEEFSIETQSKDAADNTAFESEAGFDTESTSDDILDFTERNPFGEVDEGF